MGDDRSPRPAYLGGALSIGVATGVYGFSFGVLAIGAGLSPAQAIVMSLLVFTGGSQFAAIGVIGSGGAAATAVGSGLLLGGRNVAYGLSVAKLLSRPHGRRALESHLVIDESTAMARAQDDPADARGAFLATGLAIFVLWNVGTALGAVVGGELEPETYGLDAMFPAAFLALLAPQLRLPGAPRLALVGALIAVVLIPFTPAGVPVIAASLALVLEVRRRSPGASVDPPPIGGPPLPPKPLRADGARRSPDGRQA